MPRHHNRSSMPSTSRVTARKRPVESSEDDDSSGGEAPQERTTEDLTHLVTNFVKYVINYASTKTPIKRTDMSKSLNISPKDFAAVHEEAVKILKNVYGLDLAEVPESKSGKMYMVCSHIPNVTTSIMPLDQRRESTVLFIMLAYIFMKGGNVLEENALQFISEVPLHFTDEEKEEEIKKILKLFTQQLYIKRTKVDIEGKNDPEIHLSWGQRADLEYDKKKVLESVGKIIQKSPLSFPVQYTEAHGKEPEDVVMIE